MRYWLPLGRVTRELFDDGQEVTVDVAEVLELVLDAVWETVVDADVETTEVELLAEVETDALADELEATSLAPQIAGALTAAPRLLFM